MINTECKQIKDSTTELNKRYDFKSHNQQCTILHFTFSIVGNAISRTLLTFSVHGLIY